MKSDKIYIKFNKFIWMYTERDGTMGFLKEKFSLISEAQKGTLCKTYAGQMLTFLGVFLVSTLLQSIVPCMLVWDDMMEKMSHASIDMTDSDAIYKFFMNYDFGTLFLILSLLCTAFGIATTFLYCRGFERRKISSLGFVRKNALKSYFLGALVGIAMFALCICLCVLLGGGKLSVSVDVNIGIIFAFLLGFVVQGMYEEVIFRGYFFVSTAATKPIAYAIIANSVLFSLAHGLNSGVSITGLINIVLFGVFMSLCMIYTENIWFIGALHSFWNFSQGNIFGVSTSGMNMKTSVFEFSPKQNCDYLNGGAFGLEGSLIVSVVLIISIVFIALLINKKTARKISEKVAENLRADS